MTFTTIIPKKRNDGKPIRPREGDAILNSLTDQFGGVSMEGEIQGRWVDEESGQTYKDVGTKVTVACERERLAEAEAAVKQIGRQLGQKAMYCEVRYFDGVRILKVD